LYYRAHPSEDVLGRRIFLGWIKVEFWASVSINYGSDRIKNQNVEVSAGTTVLTALVAVAEVEIIPDESATGHMGSMVTAIDGFSNDIDHAWIHYVFERGDSGWRIPTEMPDKLLVSDGMRIGWRLYNFKELGLIPKEGPRWSSRCASKTKICARQFP
jgi:hypothetical protein